MAAPAPPGRFARPGNVFAQANNNGGNHHGDQNQGLVLNEIEGFVNLDKDKIFVFKLFT